MHFIATISSAVALFTLANAAPHSATKRSGLQDLCPSGATYYGPNTCSSGFVGCLSYADNWACSRSQRFATNSCENFGSFYTCSSNGWTGCAKEDMCNKPKPESGDAPVPVPNPSNPVEPTACKCPAGSSYVKQGDCKTGFVGCVPSTVASSDYCDGTNGQNYQGWCPFGTGVYFNCYNNGFVGCTTEVGKCDAKA